MGYNVFFGLTLHTQAATEPELFTASADPASSFSVTHANLAETAVAVASPTSSFGVYLVLPTATFSASAEAASEFDVFGVSALSFASAAASASRFATQQRFVETLLACAHGRSAFAPRLGYQIGDAQQPLPSLGLALTLTVLERKDGTLYPATLYDNYPFNSFAVLGGVAYAAGPDGLYALDDGAETFTTRINLGRRDYGARLRKAIRQVGVARTEGAATAIISADAGTAYTYPVNAQRGEGRMERAVVGRGLIGSTHEVEIRGDSALAVEAVEVLLDVGARR